MENILFLNREEPVQGEVTVLSKSTIQIITEADINVSGFLLVTDGGSVYGEYEEYTTLYQEIEGGFILSNDGYNIYIGNNSSSSADIGVALHVLYK